MPIKEYAVSAKISIIWKVTTHHLKLIRMTNVDDLETYNRLSMHVIAHFRSIEEKIRTENIVISKVEYDRQLRELIKNLQK